MKFSEAVRNARLAAIAPAIGGAPRLTIHDGIAPKSITDADSGPVLVSMELPEQWLDRPARGFVQMMAEWSSRKAVDSGRAGYFRIRDAAGAVHIQGTVTADDQAGDMEIDSVNIVRGQTVTVRTFLLRDGNG